VIKFVDVGLTYPNLVRSLRGINLHIAKQEFIFIVGPTGGGKSSIMKLIYRDGVPTTGKVFVFNKDVNRLRTREIPFLRRRIGVIFQDFLLLPQKTAYDNVAYAMQIRGAGTKQVKALVPEMLEWVGLSKRMRSYPHQLSGGEQQRVCIARALVNRPDILLADEPTGNLDPDTSIEIMELAARVNSRGTTVVVATHDENIVNLHRKRTIVVSQGQIVADRPEGGYLDFGEAAGA
jgi:cell division transport system ATP-binding protein